MEFRELGRTGKKVSLLSLGCMRLPEDDEEGARVVSRAVDLGINYFETSPWYCNNRSEVKVGMGIKGRRDKVYVSTKCKMSPGTTADDVKRSFESSLNRLGVEYVDFFHVWDFREPDLEAVMGGGLEALEKLRDEGLIQHIGITSHERNDLIIEMLNTGRFEVVTLAYTMLNRTVEPVIDYASEQKIGVVIMNPLAGGLLATPSEVLSQLVPGTKTSTVAASLRFLMSNPGVSTVACGMTTPAEVEENVGTWASFTPMTEEERTALVEALEHYKALGRQFCTGCNYCHPCPNGVRIARLFAIRNYDIVFGLHEWARQSYARMKQESLPDNCTECGECEKKCPNNIPIIRQLKEVAEMYKEVRK